MTAWILFAFKWAAVVWTATFFLACLGLLFLLVCGMFAEKEEQQIAYKAAIEGLSVIACLIGSGLMVLWAMLGPIR